MEFLTDRLLIPISALGACLFVGCLLYTSLLGGSTGSRLFTNVREKLGCCYYCGARINLLTGILLVGLLQSAFHQ